MIALGVHSVCSSSGIEGELSLERIFSSPELDGPTLRHVKFSPSGKRISFLKSKSTDFEKLDLYEFNTDTGKEERLFDSDRLQSREQSEIEKAERERKRITHQGVVDYVWSHRSDQILMASMGQLYTFDLSKKKLQQLTTSTEHSLNPGFSPKDRFISFTRGPDLFLFDLVSKTELQVTKSSGSDLFFGRAEFIAQEEMDRHQGYWWSEDEEYIAFTEVDEAQVKKVDRVEFQFDRVILQKQRYPEVGTANAKIRLGLIRVADFLANRQVRPTWVPLGPSENVYLARVRWTPDGQLAYQVQSRDQKTLNLFLFDPKSSKRKKILTEKSKTWVGLHDDWFFLKKSPEFVWASERSGFKHLYLMSRSGKILRQLTKGSWEVSELKGVDEDEGFVYFTGLKETPLQRHFYRQSIKNKDGVVRLTQQSGTNEVILSTKSGRFVLGHTSINQPLQWSLHDLSGRQISWLEQNRLVDKHPLAPYLNRLTKPELGSFKGPSGDLLYYLLFRPKGFDASKQYPLIVHGYGGPGVQMVTDSWNGRRRYFADILNQHQFVVAIIDNRGSKGRGKTFEESLFHQMGTVEIEDQVAGVKHFVKQGFIDPARVGFWGWSYGGYLSLMLAGKASETFKANVAVAPVTDFRLYDTHYTERFMGIPVANEKAYKRANVLNYTNEMKGHVLVVHGMADDNVLFTHSTQLFEKFQKEQKLYESITYPGARHGLSGRNNQLHVHTSILDFFQRRL